MKVRKLAVVLALAAGLGSGLAHGLGMGEGRMLSNLNEPLRAEIELTRPGDLSAEEINVSIASRSDFERFGINRSNMLRLVDLTVVRAEDGDFIVEVSTDEPIREPYIGMLVELEWPEGRLLREYSFLVDPPSRSTGPEPRRSQASESERESQAERGRQPARDRQSRPQPEAAGGRADETQGAQEEYGPIGRNDTLWGIAGQVRAPRGATRQQVMLAFQRANPEAFVNNNINQLRRGEVLRVPSAEEIRARSAAEASREVRRQNEAHRSRSAEPERAVAEETDSSGQTADQSASAFNGGSSEQGDDKLQLLVADNDSEQGGGDIAGMGDGEGNEKLAAALEELDRTKRDREELKSRLKDLEEQIGTMEDLIELKDDQLAEMQQRLKEADQDTAIPEQQAGAEGEGGPSGEVTSAEEASEQQASADKQTGEEADKDRGLAADSTGDDGEPGPGTAKGPASGTDEGTAAEPAPADQAAADSADQQPATGEGDAAAPADEPAGTEETADRDRGTPTATEAPTSVGGFFDRLMKDPIYQISAGVFGILLLIGLWALARRNAARERAFYEQLREVSGEEDSQDPFDLDEGLEEPGFSAADERAEESSAGRRMGSQSQDDPITEADLYMAYDRYEQATERLEEAVSSEPGRVDLRLKLLEAYAGLGDSGNFEKQYRELTALDEDEAIREADALRQKLEGDSDDLSIDDLAEQLKTGSGAEAEEEDNSFDFSALEEADNLQEEESGSGDTEQEEAAESDLGSPNWSDEAIEFDLDEGQDQEAVGTDQSAESEEGGEDVSELGFSLDDLELEEPEAPRDESSTEDGDLEQELDLEEDKGTPTAGEEQATSEPAESASDESAEMAAGDFDDSFLEELDAELDRVTGEETPDFGEDETGTTQSSETAYTGEEAPDDGDEAPVAGEPESGVEDRTAEQASEPLEDVDDLELDVSEDDLALMDEFAGEAASEEDSTVEASGDEEQPEDEPLESGSEEDSIGEPLSDEEVAALEGEAPESEEPQPASEEAATEQASEEEGAGSSTQAAEGGAEGDENDEFDFLEGTDEAGTKLDLARAYVEMGDAEGARDILDEVVKEGNDDQQQEAQRLLNEL